jgi:hypothetical protein
MTAGCGTLGNLLDIYGNLLYTWILLRSNAWASAIRPSGSGWLSNVKCLFLADQSLRASELANANILKYHKASRNWPSLCSAG